MPQFEETVYIDVDLDDFEIDDIIEYLEEEGYLVYHHSDSERTIAHAAWEYKHGSVKEAVKLLEDAFPDFKGLSQKIV